MSPHPGSRRPGPAVRHGGLRAWAIAGLAVLVAACASASDRPATEAALLAAIEAEIGQAACAADAQCRTLPIGARACGGPERWLAWSDAASRGDRLTVLSDKLSAVVQARHERTGQMSTCVVVPDPGAVCRAGRCVIGGGGRAANIR
jgi:hypothetical protein